MDPIRTLRASSDAFVARLAEISEMERIKRDIPASEARFPAAAEDVERAVRLLLDHAAVQKELCWDAHRAQLETRIRELPSSASVSQLLDSWRSSERELAGIAPDSDQALDLRLDIETYRRAFHEASRAGGGPAPVDTLSLQ